MLRVFSLAAMAAIAHGNPTSDDLRAMDYSYTFKQYTNGDHRPALLHPPPSPGCVIIDR